MHGNVWEWCEDFWHSSYNNAPLDGSAWIEDGEKNERVLRGGSWSYNHINCRLTNRFKICPNNRDNNIGFRIVI
jgi:formylglycine-generating enzyme required for sulfatase activity